MIEVTGLTKRYGSKLAINNVTFSVHEGEVLGLLGPNGAGKSTTLRILVGYAAATSGRVTLAGVDLLDQPKQAKQNFGYLPESPPLYGDLTVEEYLQFVCALKDIKKSSRSGAIQHALESLNIEDVRNRLINNLSKGYQQRVGFAQAILADPPIVVLDEPTVGLDPKQIIEVRTLIQKLRDENKAILISSHILSEMDSICDRVVILNNGVIVAEDKPTNLSRQLRSGSSLRIVVEGSRNAVDALLSSLGSTMEPVLDWDEHKQTAYITCEETDDMETRRRIFSVCKKHDLTILFMAPKEFSLEEVYLQYTRDKMEI